MLTLKLHLILGFIIASVLGTLLFVALLALFHYLVSRILELSHTHTLLRQRTAREGRPKRSCLHRPVVWPAVDCSYISCYKRKGWLYCYCAISYTRLYLHDLYEDMALSSANQQRNSGPSSPRRLARFVAGWSSWNGSDTDQ